MSKQEMDSALDYLSSEGHIQVTHLGLQRKVLAELGKSQSLVRPSELYQFCLLSGELQSPGLVKSTSLVGLLD